MGLNTGLYDLMACKASALSTREKENKGGCLCSVRCLGGGEGEARGGAANSDEAKGEALQANNS